MISITIPSLHPEILVTCLENLDASTSGRFEAIVVGPHEPRVKLKRGHLAYLPEAEQQGIAAAHARAFEVATGEFVLAWADDHLLEGGWDNAALVEFLQLERGSVVNVALGLRHTAPHDDVQTIFGRYYPCFPLMRRGDVEAVGGWLSGAFRHGFSDSDLALRVWDHDGACRWSKVRPVRMTQGSIRAPKPAGYEKELNADRDLLLKAWGHLTSTWDTASASYFNVAVNPEKSPGLVLKDRTIFCPDSVEFWRARDAAAVQHVQPQ